MSSIWITGDIHSDCFTRLRTDSFPEQKEFDNQDENYVIILGDFGIIWNNDDESSEEKHKLDWLEAKNFTTLFIDGNHDNIPQINTYPVKEWHGGHVHEIRPHVLHLMRGETFNIEGLLFFCMGGASSHDISDGIIDSADLDWRDQCRKLIKQGKYMYRVKGLSWWEEELPNEEEFNNGIENLERCQQNANCVSTIDFILSHSPSTSELILLGGVGLYEKDKLTNYLDDVMANTEYKKHFFGHMHINKAINDKNICLYEQIVRIK